MQNKYFKDGVWDKEGLKGYVALPCYNSARALETTEVVQEQTVVKSTIGKATELLQYKSADEASTGLMGKIMGGGGTQISPDPKALGNITRIGKGL